MEAREDPVHRAHGTLAADRRSVQPRAARRRCVRARGRLERAPRRAHRDDAPAELAREIGPRGRGGRDLEALGIGSLAALGEDTPVWRSTGATSIPRATSSVIAVAVNGRPALGISALPGSTAKTFW